MANKNYPAQINIEFNEENSRQSLNSGDEVKTLFGKLKRWLTDLKSVAFSASYNDLSDTPTSLPANGGNADTVNQKTVLSDVPENAVFTDTTYDVVTTSANGLMSSTDKTKLDGIAENANNYSLPAATNSTLGGIKPDGTTITVTADGTISATAESITVDSELSATSENPVQNKVVKEALDGKVATVEGKGLSTNDYTAADKTKVNIITTTGDGSSYLANDGTYKAVESGDATVTDSTTGYVYSFVLENGSLKLRTYDDETTNT